MVERKVTRREHDLRGGQLTGLSNVTKVYVLRRHLVHILSVSLFPPRNLLQDVSAMDFSA